MKKLFLLLVAVLTIGLCASAQTRTVKGTVLDATNDEPLIGASVTAHGTSTGVATDANGAFTITVPSSVNKLTVSYVGYQTHHVDIASGELVIKLHPASNVLDQVIAVAYGTTKKSAYTGAASVVEADAIEGRMVTDVVSALNGTVSGVQLTRGSGQPGTSPTVRIRGIGSINAGMSPLYVVDGIPYDGEIAALNTLDVESMTVLKDAAAAALYGARGANGVILITTRRGSDSTAKVTVDARWGSNSRQIPAYNVIKDPAQYYEMAYSAIYNSQVYDLGATPAQANAYANRQLPTAFGQGYQVFDVPAGQSIIGLNGKLNPNAVLGYSDGKNYYIPDDWAKETIHNGLRQEYNVSVSGGNERFNYYVSAGYLGDEGLITGSDYNRVATRAAVDYQANKWLKIGTNVSYTYVNTGSPASQTTSNSYQNAFMISQQIAPIYPLYVRNADGSIMTNSNIGGKIYDYGDGVYSAGIRNFAQKSNYAADLLYSDTEYLMDIFNGKIYATINPVENLNITGTANYYIDNTRYHDYDSPYYGQSLTYGGTASQDFSRIGALSLQALATYNHSIAEDHHLDYLLGYESYERKDESLSGYGQGLYQGSSFVIDNTLNNESRQVSGSAGSYSTRGIFGRVNYDYANRYFFSASYRRDASSRFAPDKRWGNFFSVSAGWDAAKEVFMENTRDWLDLLKVKVSFGQQGNDNIGNHYAYLDQYLITGTTDWSDGVLGYKGNPDITWETSNNFNVGIDFSFWQGKLDGTFDYFQRQTSDMLYNKPVAPSNGYSSIPMNVGSIRNSGLELELNYRPIQTKDITWNINFNATYIKNKILSLHEDLHGQMISGIRLLREGDSVYELFMVEYAGVNPETGEMQFLDANPQTDADGNILKDEYGLPLIGEEFISTDYDHANQYNRKRYGDILPPVYGGFGTTLQAYGFDFSVQFAYQFGGHMIDYGYKNLLHSGDTQSLGTNWHADMLNAWTPTNTNTDFPKLNSTAKYSMSDVNTSFDLISSNYLALNNITVGYTLPTKFTKHFGVESLRIYGTADNVAVWAKRKGLDPRTGYTSANSGEAYSASRNISGGIKVVF